MQTNNPTPTPPSPAAVAAALRLRDRIHPSERHFYDNGVNDRRLGLSRASNRYIHVDGSLLLGSHAWAAGWEDEDNAIRAALAAPAGAKGER